ncbi:RNA polymerase subunit sigma-70 [Pantoea rodasii]|uniref:RNA polymerase subunit sigma-70 n=1 Tax=Pantoea rodasii TaxID=1076549 RepID=A0A2M9WHB3_9GAMM|nr:sigma-70 family RNA polymerase sigma factor [Pantoea rodasii]ORM61970.1 hypothetical protein HA45_19220 [Pantoea rodasii]PJZ06951.1 RNA polymerase subunit sigma-70 [Pantoea rodasii]
MSAFERYYTELFRFLSGKLRDKHLAEEMTQETFSRALASQEQISSHRGLLYHIARNLLVDRYRLQKQYEPSQDIAADELLAPGHEQPDSLLENQRYMDHIVAAIETLPPRCREAFIRHRIEGQSQSEVAASMGISTNMVEKHIIRAMLACRASRDSWRAEQSTRKS